MSLRELMASNSYTNHNIGVKDTSKSSRNQPIRTFAVWVPPPSPPCSGSIAAPRQTNTSARVVCYVI